MTTAQKETAETQPRLLVVDDEVELRSLLAMKFGRSGYMVDLAANGAEAAAMMDKAEYAAILCDLNLPTPLKGRELFELAKNTNKKSKFIAITGYAPDSPEVKAARAAGIEHVFSKPLRLKAILAVLDNSI